MSNSPQRQRGFPQQHPGMYPQQMYPPQGPEGYPPPGYAGGPPQAPPPPMYGHPAGAFPPYGYGAPPGGYPPQSYYPPPGGPYAHGYPQSPYGSPVNAQGGPMAGSAAAGNQFMNDNNNNNNTKQPNSSPKNGKTPKSERKGQSGSGGSDSPADFGTVKSAISSTSRFNNNSGNNNDFESQVSPMRSDFHFFAEENKDAATSIDKEASGSSSKDGKKTAFQSVSELNERLMSMWEKSSSSDRNAFMVKEEADRERFMNEDEIESRHCATLTSRTRPLTSEKPERVTNVVTKDEDEDQSDKVTGSKRQGTPKGDGKSEEGDEDYESPTKKVKEEEKDQTTEKDSP